MICLGEYSIGSRKKTLYFTIVGWGVLYMAVRSCWLIVWFRSFISLPIFFLVVLSVAKGGVLKSQL